MAHPTICIDVRESQLLMIHAMTSLLQILEMTP